MWIIYILLLLLMIIVFNYCSKILFVAIIIIILRCNSYIISIIILTIIIIIFIDHRGHNAILRCSWLINSVLFLIDSSHNCYYWKNYYLQRQQQREHFHCHQHCEISFQRHMYIIKSYLKSTFLLTSIRLIAAFYLF